MAKIMRGEVPLTRGLFCGSFTRFFNRRALKPALLGRPGVRNGTFARFSVVWIAGAVMGAGVFFTGCASTIMVTPSIRSNFSNEQLEDIQYSVSTTIVLSRKLDTSEQPAVSSGVVVIKNGERLEEIELSRATPGLLMGISSQNRAGRGASEVMGVCFEADDADLDKILYFIQGRYDADYPEGYYLLMNGTKPNAIRYGSKEYNVEINPESASAVSLYAISGNENPDIERRYPYLLGKMKVSNKKEADRRKIKGRKLPKK